MKSRKRLEEENRELRKSIAAARFVLRNLIANTYDEFAEHQASLAAQYLELGE